MVDLIIKWSFFILLSCLIASSVIGQSILCNSSDSSKCYSIEKLKINKLSLKKLYELSDTVGAASTIFAADIDQDCIPELISLYASSNKILISDTRSKKIKKIIDVAVVETTGSSFAIGDIDLDGMPEFFILAASNSRNPNNISGRILCYNLDGSIRWISNVKINTTFGNDFIALLSLADFNQDGIPEIYTKNLIFNALTGIKILDGGMNGIGTKHDVGYVTDGLSVAGNLDDDPSDLELAAGYTIYKVKINNVNGIIGNSIIPMNISINGEFRDGLTSLGDINNDGRLDVIVACPGSIGTGMIYAYCLKSGSTQLIAKVFIQNQNTSIGAASIGDIKGNGTNSIIVVKSSKLYSFSFDGTTSLNEDWVMDCTDRSGAVGTILFDLNNDNKSEIILRDETDLRIIDGSSTTPITLLSLPCISDTGNEQPIIGDLDNSGQSKICIPCGFELSQQIGYVTVFGSSNPDSGWAPARPIWNQYAYNPLFINDDLTVPRVQKNQATFQKGKYNNFMQQESYVDSNGMVKKPAASLSGRINCVNYDINKKAYHITFDIFNRNNASAIADSNLLVSFYSDNPELGASLIGTYNSKIPINPGDSLLNLEIWITASNLNKLYLIVNSKRNSNGGFSDVDFIISECDYTDNIFQTIDLPKFDTLDVEICPGEKYVFFQSVITNVGQYYHSTNSTKNCDSLITILNLQYKQNCIPNCNNKDSSKCYTVEKFQSSNFSIEKKIQSKDLVSGNQPPLLADMDGDCIPEFIITGENYQGATSDVIYIIDSETGITKWEIVTPLIEFDLAGLAIADIDADGIPEIFIETRLTSDSLSQKLLCYRSDGKLIWVSDNKVINQNSNPNNIYGGTPALADFNEDGIPEIYVNNKIFNARSGHLLADGGSGGLGGVQMNGYYEDGLTIAAQLDDNPADLELAAGYSIYKVVLTNLNGIFGNSMIAYNIKVDNVYRDGYTTVADINSDGRLDVIVTSAGISGLLYAYTLLKGTTQLIAKVYTGSTLERIGPPFIGDINGSARPSILFTRLKTLNAFSYNGTTNFMYDWSLSTSDKSGCTGMTMFDFNNDGIEEIVYRDETTLRIIDGSTTQPKELANILCLSQTRREYPIVGDFDNSGHAKICVPCGVDPTKLLGKLTVFSSIKKVPGWAPARGVWNQYAYNPLQINDDLTVPQFQKNQAIFNNGKFNNFFVQESYVDSNGIVKKPAVSLSGRISCINYDVVTMTYSVIFDVFNRKDASQDADTNLIISFYNGDPNTNGIFIGSYHTDQFLFAGDSLLNLVYRFQIMDLKDFFMVVNTKRTSNGTFDDPDFIQLECDYTDNISRSIDIPKIEDLNASICSGDRFQFFGTTLTDSGIYEHKTYKFNGCDSVITILKLNAVDTVHSIQNVNTCDSYFWNGQNYTLSGIYNHDTLSVNGCDSSATLNLTINNSDQKNIIQSVCDSLIWNGMNLVQSGTYEDRRINISGCDSITSLQLTIHPSSSNSITQSACDHYDWNGQTYDKSGTYAYKGQSIYGCDSLITLQLTIDSIIQSNIKQTACNTYSWNNMLFSQSGTYESKALSQQGCDSITTLDLII
ncbi:MAG: VCBS repeat-containing protein, partial [Saprospiraceae bacterium]